MMNFGDIFSVEGKEFVYLLLDEEIIFAARILREDETRMIKNLRIKADRKGSSHQQPLLCYVELSTRDYVNCSANMLSAANGGIDGNLKLIRSTDKKLEDVDLKNIKKEILDSSELFRPNLTEFMKSIPL